MIFQICFVIVFFAFFFSQAAAIITVSTHQPDIHYEGNKKAYIIAWVKLVLRVFFFPYIALYRIYRRFLRFLYDIIEGK